MKSFSSPALWRALTSGAAAALLLISAMLMFAGVRDAIRRAALVLVAAGIRREFPDVPAISTAELAERLLAAESCGAPPLLVLDAREPAEFAASHLPGAQWVPPAGGSEALPAGFSRGQPIVVYCSVGYRSALVARRLRAAGCTDVRNLDGSIFRWADEGRPLARGGTSAAGGETPTTQVHPYNPRWGLLLQPARRAPLAR